MNKTFVLIITVFIHFTISAASVDTVAVYSNAMQKYFKCVVIKPSAYKKKTTRFPVVYLLHGYSGWYSNWILQVPALKEYADTYRMIIVCPDGGYSSWYFDSPLDLSFRFETYIGTEVPAFIDMHYRTIPNRNGRAITGLSMGGHGGMFLGMRHAAIFGACGSMSGGLDLNYSRSKFDIIKRIGDTISHAANWKKYIVINVLDDYITDLRNKKTDSLQLIFDCGLDDFYIEPNQKFHQKLVQYQYPHDYTERPGSHNWDYWRNAIAYQLLFFSNYFKKSATDN
jgi:S-formylglutathione hydrolase FrmB